MPITVPIVQPVYESSVPVVTNGAGFGVINEAMVTFRPFSGGETGGTYEGPHAVLEPLITTLCNNGYNVDYKRSKSPISTLSFRAAFNSGSVGGPASNPNIDYSDTWELLRNTTQKELLESDHPLVSQLGAGNYQILKNLMTGTGNDEFDTNENTFIPNTPSSPTSYDAAIYLWALFQSGVKTIPVKQPIVQLTRTTNPFYTAPFFMDNVDSLMTTATMISDSGLPASFAIPVVDLAYALEAKAGNMIARATEAGISLKFGWYKDLVSSNKHGNKRYQYILRYEFGLFDSALYGNPV